MSLFSLGRRAAPQGCSRPARSDPGCFSCL
jgi:hypothetical protein